MKNFTDYIIENYELEKKGNRQELTIIKKKKRKDIDKKK